MKTYYLITLVLYLLSVLVVYLFLAFCEWEWAVNDWYAITRGLLATYALFSAIVLFCLVDNAVTKLKNESFAD